MHINMAILMHLQMQRDVCLDNVINLRNVAFDWLTSEYMQLASGLMQLALGATKYIFTVFFKRKIRERSGSVVECLT